MQGRGKILLTSKLDALILPLPARRLNAYIFSSLAKEANIFFCPPLSNSTRNLIVLRPVLNLLHNALPEFRMAYPVSGP